MSTAHLVLTIIAAAMVGFSAVVLFLRVSWITESMELYGVPVSWWHWLAAAKAAGAIGLLVGLAVPAVGVAAAIGLILYFTGATVTVARARRYSHVGAPVMYVLPVIAAFAFGLAA